MILDEKLEVLAQTVELPISSPAGSAKRHKREMPYLRGYQRRRELHQPLTRRLEGLAQRHQQLENFLRRSRKRGGNAQH